MKILLLLLVVLVGCSNENSSGQEIRTPYEACVNGHTYYYSFGSQYGGSYMSPKFDIKGNLVSCSMKANK